MTTVPMTIGGGWVVESGREKEKARMSEKEGNIQSEQ